MATQEARTQDVAMAELEQAYGRLAQEYARVAAEHGHLANQLAACHRLHSTLDRAEVLLALEEVVASLLGCEDAAVYEARGEGEPYELLARFGPGEAPHALPEPVLDAVRAGRTFGSDAPAVPGPISAGVPLRVGSRTVGVLVLFRLLGHKPRLAPADWDLLELLETHAATAFLASREGVPSRTGP